MSTLPTPRTDAALAWVGGNAPSTVIQDMRKLERELTEAKAERDALKAALAIGQENCDAEYNRLRDERDEMTKVAQGACKAEGEALKREDRWRALAEELAEALAMAKCPECDGSGVVQRMNGNTEYVSREMALDAGDPSLEGSVYREAEPEVCQCAFCAMKAERLARFRDAANPAPARTPPGTHERSRDEC